MPSDHRACSLADLAPGTMRAEEVEGVNVLLVRLADRIHAVHGACTHYGAPLAEGALRIDADGARVICPWHHACFDVQTGDQCEPPGLDALPRYPVRLDGDDVYVTVPVGSERGDAPGSRTPMMAARDSGDDRAAVIVGAGAVAQHAAERLRQCGWTGRVVIIGPESAPPYDRTNCSKSYLQGAMQEDAMPLRSAEFYRQHDIERLEARVTSLDADARAITLATGETLVYDGAILATGGTPRPLDAPGADLPGVHALRSLGDSRALREAARDAARVVIVGASFIGMEAAFSLRKLGVEHVTVVAPGDVPFAGVFGEAVGRRIQKLHEENGVTFALGSKVEAITGEARARGVRLESGDEIDADLVLVGIGVTPATDYAEGALERRDDGGITTDASLRAADRVWAAGDIAAFPDPRADRRVRIEHWRLAAQHGRLAADNLVRALGARQGDTREEPKAFDGAPFFWTAHFGTNFRYVGHAEDFTDILYDGDPADGPFIAYYIEGEGEMARVAAALGTGRDADLAALHHLLLAGAMPSPEDVRGGFDPAARLAEINDSPINAQSA